MSTTTNPETFTVEAHDTREETAWALTGSAALTVAPMAFDLIDASTPLVYVGGGMCTVGVLGLGYIFRDRGATQNPLQVGAASLAVTSWGGYTVWAAMQPSLATLAVGGLLSFGSWLAARTWRMKRIGTPLERREQDVRLAQEKVKVERMELQRAKMSAQWDKLNGPDEDPDDDPTRVLPSTRWAGPKEGAGVLDTIEIAPGVFVPVDSHMLIGGRTGAGKSGILDLLLCSMLSRRRARVTAIDMKPGAPELGLYRRAGVRVVSEPKEAEKTLRYLNEQLDWRGEELGRLTAETGRKHSSWKPTEEHPHLFLVIDELTEMLDALGAGGKGLFYRLLRLARAVAITLVCATQSPRAKMFGDDAGASGRGQFGTRVCLSTKQSTETRLILDDLANEPGWKDAHRMPKAGHFLISSDEHTMPKVHRAFHAGDDMVTRVIHAASGEIAFAPPKPLDAPVMPSFTSPDYEPEAFPEAPRRVVPGPQGTVADRVMAHLAEHGASKPATVADAIGDTRETVKAAMARMRKTGALDSDGSGTYSLPADRDNVVPFAHR